MAQQGAENLLLSPLSAQITLATAANGAAGQTFSEMETVVGGELSLSELNRYLYSYQSDLQRCEGITIRIANSLWLRKTDDFSVQEDFLKTCAAYYTPQIYCLPFDDQALKDINNWVKQKTDGKIEQILEEIPFDTTLYLLNAFLFDGTWSNTYTKENIRDGQFQTAQGTSQPGRFLHSKEHVYLENARAFGFLKYYKGGRFAFGGLLPKDSKAFADFAATLTAEEFSALYKNRSYKTVNAAIPCFTANDSLNLNPLLQSMGISSAFDSTRADFSGITDDLSLCIGSVLQKTCLELDEHGTVAAATTQMSLEAIDAEEPEAICLNRPFVYFILDTETGIPLFLGTVTSMET